MYTINVNGKDYTTTEDKKLLSFLVVTAMICSLVSFGTAFAAEETVVFSYDFDSSTVADGRQLCGDIAKVAADYSAKYLAASDQVYVTTDPANQSNRVAWICSKCTPVGGYATNANAYGY